MKIRIFFKKNIFFVIVQVFLMLCFIQNNHAMTCKSIFSDSKPVKVKLSNSKFVKLNPISYEEFKFIQESLQEMQLIADSKVYDIAWGQIGFDCGPCRPKADLIRYYLTTGNLKFTYPSFSKQGELEGMLKKSKAILADSLSIDLFSKPSLEFSFEYVLSDGSKFKPINHGDTEKFYAKRKWGNHSAVVINVEGELVVFDPLLKSPSSLGTWINTFNGKEKVTVKQLTTQQYNNITMEIYAGSIYKKSSNIKAGFYITNEFKTPNSTPLVLWEYMRSDIELYREINGLSKLSDKEIEDLIKGSYIEVKDQY